MSHATKISVNTSLPTIGQVSPYSYQVKAKKPATEKFVVWDGESRLSRLTKGQGKGVAPRFYAYFMDGDFQHWIELTEATYQALATDKSQFLLIERAAPVEVLAEVIAEATPITDTADAAAKVVKGRKAKREAVEA